MEALSSNFFTLSITMPSKYCISAEPMNTPLYRPSRVIMGLTLLKPMPHLQGQRFSKSGKELSQLISVSVKAAPLLRNF
jgi:hypothetical protein